MEKYYIQSLGTPIITEEGRKAGTVIDIIINPETGKICAFTATTGAKKVIAPIDIIKWGKIIIIHDQFDIVDIDDIAHARNVINKDIPIQNNKVYTEAGDYIGKVGNIGFNNKFFNMTCLIVAKRAVGVIQYDEKIIPAKDIIEITKKKIIVKNLMKPVKLKKLKVDMAATS